MISENPPSIENVTEQNANDGVGEEGGAGENEG